MALEDHADRVLTLVASIPSGRVLAYGDVAKRLGGMGPRTVGSVMSRYGSDVPWWRVIRSDGRPPQGLEDEALEHWRAEGTPMVRGLVEGARAAMGAARWDFGGMPAPGGGGAGTRGGLHHVEIWVEDIAAAGREWGWLLGRLGYTLGDDWGHGQAWELGSLYVVVESGPDVEKGRHERKRAGLNHLAFHGGSRAEVDALVEACAEGGWSLMFEDRHPYAGGPEHYAAYLESGEGFEVELVAEGS
ncbi:MGMT family protein [Intrasporangium flavum]|uniref:MGMT family protein n=1 Tax=Intrasporangium flavum TaxID=1428657 RepID=UPI00096E207D|nr:MGMT family protein [Intrasporangium flavum]